MKFAVRWLLWNLGRTIGRLKKPPDFVSFVIDEAHPVLKAPKGKLWQRPFAPRKRSLQELAGQFKAVAGDHRVRGVVLQVRPTPMPLAHLQEIRSMISGLKAAGKRVVAWSTHYETGSLYVASAADEVLMQRAGQVGPLGVVQTYPYLGDSLRRLGMQADFVQISPYKSAADPLMRREMTEEVKEMANWLIDANYQEVVTGLAEGRRISEEDARAVIDGSPYADLAAVEAGAVDALVSEEELPARLGGRIATWEQSRMSILQPAPKPKGRHVALVRIEGSIVDGRSKNPPFKLPRLVPLVGDARAGDLTVVQQIRAAARDRRAAAILLFVESGGGSAASSEAMASALEAAAKRKPVVASMGWVAGSGGYWVTTPARWVVAHPSTITASIGVLHGKVVSRGSLEKLLINMEVVDRGRNVRFERGLEPYSDDQRKTIWEGISRVYDLFLEKVSTARSMTRDEVDAIGGGRVFTGRQALERGLVDELGGLEVALAKARELAGLPSTALLREVKAAKRPSAPLPQAAAALTYAAEGLRMLNGTNLAILPFTGEEPG